MIARTRKRPRVKSVNFRTFWWLLRMEASLRVVANTYGSIDLMTHRYALANEDHRATFRRIGTVLRMDRGARWWP